jgi:hypothetical protein
VNQRKDGRVGAYAKGQSDHGGRREPFALQKLPEGEAKIFDHDISDYARTGRRLHNSV